MWIAGEGNGSLITGFAYVWRDQGGILGFLHLASDLQLAASTDGLIAKQAAGRLHTKRQCHEEAGMIRLLESENRPEVQRWLLQGLAACNSQKAIPTFRRALSSQNDGIALIGAQSLGMVGAREAIPDLIPLVGRCNAQCSGTAAAALARLGEREVSYSWAIKALKEPQPGRYNSDDRYMRYHASHVLRWIGTTKDIPLLEDNMHASAGGTMETKDIIEFIRSREKNH